MRRAVAALVVTACGVGLAGPATTPAHADPDAVAAAQARLDAIEAQASQVDANYTQAQADLDAANATLASATSAVSTSQHQVDLLRSQLGALALVNFQSAGLGTTTRLFTSADDTSFLDSLATVQNVTERSNVKLQQLQAAEAAVVAAQSRARTERQRVAAIHATQSALAAQYAQKEADAKAVLAKLTAQEKQRLAALKKKQAAAALAKAKAAAAAAEASRAAARTGLTTSTAAPAPASGRAAAAIQFAMAQVGKAYVMGATGPSAYDCSGLMLRAWGAAGVSLPRTSQAQFGVGTPVAISDLQPGDLVFYYSGVTHVAMYIGNGMIVHAANPRRGVLTAPVSEMPIVGARRVG